MPLADGFIASLQWWVAGTAAALAVASVRAAFGRLPRGLPGVLVPGAKRGETE